MDDILGIALSALHQDTQRMDSVATNMANFTTPGYRREVMATAPFVQTVDTLAALASTAIQAAPAGSVDPLHPVAATRVDMHHANLKATGEPLDLALTGEGYFEVMTDNGLAYTRNGDFAIDAKGRLVTAQGNPVMGKNGEIHLTTPHPTIDATGLISEDGPTMSAAQANAIQERLKVVTFTDTRQMSSLGSGLLSPGESPSLVDDAAVQIKQGMLEGSNVNQMQEILNMMTSVRHAESMQKVIQGYDDVLGTAIHKLGDLS